MLEALLLLTDSHAHPLLRRLMPASHIALLRIPLELDLAMLRLADHRGGGARLLLRDRLRLF